MKKKALSIAVLLASVFAVSSVAQNPSSQVCQTPGQCQAAQCDKSQCPGKPQCLSPFAGLNLTDKQKSELEALKPSKEQVQAQKAEAKAKKEADRQQRRDQKQQSRKDYLSKVKAILTPEQYVQFLENSYVNQAPKGDKNKNRKDGKGSKGHRHHGNKNVKEQRSDKK